MGKQRTERETETDRQRHLWERQTFGQRRMNGDGCRQIRRRQRERERDRERQTDSESADVVYSSVCWPNPFNVPLDPFRWEYTGDAGKRRRIFDLCQWHWSLDWSVVSGGGDCNGRRMQRWRQSSLLMHHSLKTAQRSLLSISTFSPLSRRTC